MVSSYKFYSRNDILHVRINGGTRNEKTRISLKINISGLSLKDNRIQGRSPRASSINNQILYFEKLILESTSMNQAKLVISSHLAPSKKTTATTLMSILNNYADGMANGEIKTKTGKKFSKPTITTFSQLRNYYIDYGIDISVDEVDLYSLDAKSRRIAIRRCTETFNGFMDYLMESDLSVSYQHTLRAKLMAVINYAKKTLGIDIPGEVRPVQLVVDPIEIPTKYYKVLMDHGVPPKKKYDEVYNLMIRIQLQTALRISDITSLTRDSFTASGGSYFVSSLNEKTKQRTYAPVTESVWLEVQKNIKETGEVFRDVFNGRQKKTARIHLNNYIKRICKYKITEKLNKTKQNPDGSVEVISVSADQVVTSHDLRRLAINYYLHNGADETTVKNLTGHTRSSKAFEEHYKGRYSSKKVEKIIDIQSELD